MLIRFVVENFLSFKDRTEFYMSAGSTVRHKSHVMTEQGQRVLKGSFLFGANAGGKSNFLKAVKFARDIVRSDTGLKNIDCDNKHFRIDSSYKTKPGVFQFDFMTNGHLYSYGFAVSYAAASIDEEWLYQMDGGKELCIFEREWAEEKRKFDIQSEYSFQNKKSESRFEFLTELFTGKNPKKKQLLFLTEAVLNSSEDDMDYQPFRDVVKWFFHVMIIFPDSPYGGIFDLMNEKGGKYVLSSMLSFFDTGIETITKREAKFDDFFSESVNLDVLSLKNEIEEDLRDARKVVRLDSENSHIEVWKRQGNLYAGEIMTSHGNEEDLFNLSDESDGTCRLFDLIPIYQEAFRKDCVIFVDELDRSLHTKAVQEFIRMFYELTEGKSSQLIATVHDSNLLDLDLLRNDEIWFVDRQKDHSSRLYSLSEFKSRFDRDVEREYLVGRYGALPVFRQSALADMEDGKNVDDIREGGGDSE